MTTCKENILKQCDRLEEQIRRICHLISLKPPGATSGHNSPPINKSTPKTTHFKTIDTNSISQVIELSSYANKKDVLFVILNDAFLKMERARSLADFSNPDNALQELCDGFMMSGMAYSKLYSPGLSMTVSEAAVKASANAKSNKDELINIVAGLLKEWDDFDNKITADYVSKKVAHTMTKDNKYIEVISKNWPKTPVKKDASDLKSLEEVLARRLISYFSREDPLIDLMREIREISRQKKR